MAFPTAPSYGDPHVLGGKTFRWGGMYWSAVLLADQAAGAGATPSPFMRAVQSPPWVQTLVTSYPSGVNGNHGGALVTYI